MRAKSGNTEQRDIEVLSELMVSLGFKVDKISVDELDQDLLKTFNDLEIPDAIYSKYDSMSAVTEISVYRNRDEVKIELCEPLEPSLRKVKKNIVIQHIMPYKTMDYNDFYDYALKHGNIDMILLGGDN